MKVHVQYKPQGLLWDENGLALENDIDEHTLIPLLKAAGGPEYEIDDAVQLARQIAAQLRTISLPSTADDPTFGIPEQLANQLIASGNLAAQDTSRRYQHHYVILISDFIDKFDPSSV